MGASGLHAKTDLMLYGYLVTQWVCIVFITFFSLSTGLHLFQGVWYKNKILVYTIIPGGLLEIIGWSGRLWSSLNQRLLSPYLMQICCLIIAPCFLQAANYLILGVAINRLGQQYARVKAKWYTLFFCSGDLISLVIQAVGGAMAALAVQCTKTPCPNPNKGAKIMMIGIIVQMVVMVLFTAIGAEFIIRYYTNKPFHKKNQDTPARMSHSEKEIKRTRLVIVGLAVSTLLIFIRSVYRTIELSDGWTGPIIRNQQLFNCLDGLMIVLAMIILNILNPGHLWDTRNFPISFHDSILKPKVPLHDVGDVAKVDEPKMSQA